MDYYEAYVRLEMGAIDDVDAAIFSGDIFHDEENRKRFRKILERWTKEMDVLDASGFGLNP
jgi:DNA repair exonuclease SbcCD nuclease subunit